MRGGNTLSVKQAKLLTKVLCVDLDPIQPRLLTGKPYNAAAYNVRSRGRRQVFYVIRKTD